MPLFAYVSQKCKFYLIFNMSRRNVRFLSNFQYQRKNVIRKICQVCVTKNKTTTHFGRKHMFIAKL